MKLTEIVTQLKKCNYECVAGSLVNNVAFVELEKIAGLEKPILQRSKDTTVNICNYCTNYPTFPECLPDHEFVFGNGLGNDNIIACINYDGTYFNDK